MRNFTRTRDWPACVKFHAAVSSFSFLRVASQYWQSLEQTPSDYKRGAEAVGTLTHAEHPRAFITLIALCPASCMRLSRFTIKTHMKSCFAGATHASQSRMHEQIRMTLKTPLTLILWKIDIFKNSSIWKMAPYVLTLWTPRTYISVKFYSFLSAFKVYLLYLSWY
jgi:hypothetical protein